MIDLTKQELINKDFTDDKEKLLLIQKAFFNVKKWFITLDEAAFLWHNYGSNLFASWLPGPESDKDIINHIELNDNFKGYEQAFKKL